MGRLPEAHLELQKAVDVTPTMARELIEELKRLDVPYVVAPYEADSQLAYLEKQGIISGVLSEDSDLLVFGVKCLLTKLDQYGECVMIHRHDFTACREISLVGWTDKEFRIMAMLSGCDYLPGIDKMGLKTAYRYVRKHKVIERIVRSVQFDGKMKVPSGYLDAFTKAERTFLYQWVFCPEARCLANLNQVPDELGLEVMPYIGQQVEPAVAAAVATGELNPNTKETIVLSSHRPFQHPATRPKPVQTPDEKHGKPISEFFKPKRTPLAELDPNSFTPSPSQQRLLQNQQGTSWSASQVPVTVSAATPNVPASAPQATRRAVTDSWSAAHRKSPKRQRLCSDSVLAESMNGTVGLEAATSRFFSKQGAPGSPSRRKASEQRKKKKDEFDLWSDDSAAEAVAVLTATHEATPVEATPSPKNRKKLQVFADAEIVEHSPFTRDRPRSIETSQETEASEAATAATLSQCAATGETPAKSFEVEETQTQRAVFSEGIDASLAALQTKYVFNSKSNEKTVSRTKSAPQVSRSALQSRERKQVLGRLAGSGPLPGTPQRPVKEVFEPGQGRREAAVKVVPMSSPIAESLSVTNVLDEADNQIYDEDWLAMEHHEASPEMNFAVHGSEDLLVPESPESADGGRRKPLLNLGRFAFAR